MPGHTVNAHRQTPTTTTTHKSTSAFVFQYAAHSIAAANPAPVPALVCIPDHKVIGHGKCQAMEPLRGTHLSKQVRFCNAPAESKSSLLYTLAHLDDVKPGIHPLADSTKEVNEPMADIGELL
jgi:hypothetical protein